MLRVSFVALFIIAAVARADDPPKLEWKEFKSEEGRFKALVPGKVVTSSKYLPTALGKMYVFTINVRKDLAFLIVYFDNLLPALDTEESIKSVAIGVNGKGELLLEKEITLGKDKILGREIITDDGHQKLRDRIFLHKNRLYQVVVQSPSKEEVSSQDADKFLDSFEILADAAVDKTPPKFEWKEYTSETGGFKALVPGKVTTIGESSKAPIFSIQISNELWFMLNYSDYPISNAKPQDQLKAAVEKVNAEGKLILDKEITLSKDTIPGREIISDKGHLKLRDRIYIDKNRLYEVKVVGPSKEVITSKDADKFLDSFEIIARVEKSIKLEWKEFKSEEGRFKVLMPGPVSTQEKEISTPAGKMKLYIFSVEPAKEFACIVEYNDYPETNTKTEEIIKLAVQGVTKQGEILLEKDIKLGKEKIPGREVIVKKTTGDKEWIFREWIFVDDANARLYQVLIVGTTKEFVTSKDADKFLESFEIKK